MKSYPFLDLTGNAASLSFKNWLVENNPLFSGYDSQGSGLTVICDLLGQYLTQNAYIANMMHNESSIYTSKTWNNKASLASMRGVVPHKHIGARTTVTMTLESTDAVVLKKQDVVLVGADNGIVYPFSPLEDIITTRISDTSISATFTVVQGLWKTYSFKSDIGFSRYEIPADDIDISTLRVYVFKKNSSTQIEYKVIKSFADVTEYSFALVVGPNGKYNIVFGDSYLANKPAYGSDIYIEYIATDGKIGNSIQSIGAVTDILGNKVIDIAHTPIVGGKDPMSMADIDLIMVANNAVKRPETYYQNLLLTEYPDIKDIIVIDGETMATPRYGYIYFYIHHDNLKGISGDILKTLNRHKLNPSIFRISAPEYIDIDVNITVINNTPYSTSNESVKSNIVKLLTTYSTTDLSKISSGFFPSEVITLISNTFSNLKIVDTSYEYVIYNYEVLGNTIDLHIPDTINVSSILYNNKVYKNISEIGYTTKSEICIKTDDDSSYIDANSYWVPRIRNIRVDIR